MRKPLNVLIVDDSADDVLFIVRELMRGGYDPGYERVDTAKAMDEALGKQSWDIIICDYALPFFSGPDAIELLKKSGIDIPLIIVSGAITEETAVQTMKAGAHDFVMKRNLARLTPAVVRELREAAVRKENRTAEEALRESEALFRKLFEQHAAVKLIIDPADGRIIDANASASEFYGWPREQLTQMSIQDINTLPPEELKSTMKEVIDREKIHFEFHHRLADGSIRDVEVFSSKIEVKGKDLLHSIVHDITDRKQAEIRDRMTREVLELLNRPEGPIDTVHSILHLIKHETGFEAVAIRLREGDDFPYYKTNGFPQDFLEAEKYLCARDKEGKIIRDGNGKPLLECMCGNVLSGQTNPALPFFTEMGSFWTNYTTELLASTTEADRQARTRNRCNGEGYESVALIPLRTGDETIGLLQLNDRRKNRFTYEMVRFFEGLGASIGIAISRKQAEETLQRAKQAWEEIFQAIGHPTIVIGPEWNVVAVNRAALKSTGLTEAEMLGKPCYEIFHPGRHDIPPGCPTTPLLESAKAMESEMDIEALGGVFHVHCTPTFDEAGKLKGIIHVMTDITQQKQTELALREKQTMLEEAYRLAEMGAWSWTKETDALEWSGEIYRMFGLDPQPAPPTMEEHRRLYAPGYWKRRMAGNRRVLETGEPYQMEVELIRPDGSRGWVQTFCGPKYDAAGKITGLYGTVQDITQRKLDELALQEKQQRLVEAHRIARMGAWTWLRETNALTWSPGIYHVFGRDPNLPAPQVDVHERMYAPGDWEERLRVNKDALKKGKTYQLDLQFFREDGSKGWLSTFGGPWYDAAGRIIGLQGTVQDITEQKQAQIRERKETEWKDLLFWLYGEAPQLTDKEIFDYTLERIVKLTDSKIGFFHRISEDEKTIVLTSWNQEALENCSALFDNHYPIESAGNWVDSLRFRKPVIYNDFPNSPNQKGLPVGHAPINRFMSIPVLDSAIVKIIFGVGNKEDEYDDFDLVQVQLMANDLQKVIAHRRAEEALRTSEKRYREMMELLPVAVFEADAAGRAVSYNPAAIRMFGLKAKDVERELSIFDFVSGKDRKGVQSHFAGVMDGRSPLFREYEALRSDGTVFPAMVFSSHIKKEENITGLRGVVLDMSDIKAAEEALRLSEKKYRDIYDNATEGIFQSTPDGRILTANRSLALIIGYTTPEEMLADLKDLAWKFYVNPGKRQVLADLMARQGFVTDFEIQAYRRDGSKIWISVNAHTVRDEKGELLYYEGTMADISRRKEAEEQLRQAYLVLQETNEKLVQADKLAAVGTLAAGVAHEILNPLNIITIGIAALQTTQALSDPVREAFDIFQRQVDRVVRIARDLQQFSRKSAIRMEPVQIQDVIESTLALCEPRLKLEDVKPVIECDGACPLVTMDRHRIGQVLLNIFNNALDTMAGLEHKALRITTAIQADPGDSRSSRLLIAVSDRGRGIDPPHLEHLFDPFFTTKEPGKGTGLGLSISHTIVQNHGGKIWAENNPEGGATFFIELPVNHA